MLIYWALGLAQGCGLSLLVWVTIPIVWEEVRGWKRGNEVTRARSAKT